MITGVWSICNSSYEYEMCVYNYMTIVVITMVNRTTLHPYSFSKKNVFFEIKIPIWVMRCFSVLPSACGAALHWWWVGGAGASSGREPRPGAACFAARRWTVRQGRCFNHQLILWLLNIAMEHGPFIDDFPIKPPFIMNFPWLHGYVK